MINILRVFKVKSRLVYQLVFACLFNGYLVGFAKGRIFGGSSKVTCVPVLNCYSCPGATGACPIGAMQAVAGDNKYKISFYVLGLIMLFGVVFGRLICAVMCPFGLVQDLLYKIKIPKIKVNKKLDSHLRRFKYIMLLAVLILPVIWVNKYGISAPYFCKLVCPAGTLEGGIPLLIKNPSLRNSLGLLFSWKLCLLIIILGLSVINYRPFCKYVCPLGAFYSLFNRFSFYQMKVDLDKCNGCGQCERTCKMDVDVCNNINSAECIRCGECIDICKQDAIRREFNIKMEVEKNETI